MSNALLSIPPFLFPSVLLSFSLSLYLSVSLCQEAEWHCDEFTKGACFSRGKSEVGKQAQENTYQRKTHRAQHTVYKTVCNSQLAKLKSLDVINT